MNDLDPNLRALLSRSHEQLGPPPGVEGRMLADFYAQLGPGPGGSGGGEGLGQPGSGLEFAGAKAAGGSAKLLYGLKVVGAVLGLTAAGVGGLWLVGQGTRGSNSEPVAVAQVESSEQASADANRPKPVEAPSAPEMEFEPEPEDSRAAAEDTPEPQRPQTIKAEPHEAKAETKTPSATLAAELKLIRAARSAPAAQALELLERHASDFPTGSLASEREALRAVALCELGRTQEAQQARGRLEQLQPGPMLLDKVSKACGAS